MAARCNSAWGHGQFTIQIIGVRNATHMPELQENATACCVHRLGHQLPARYLFLIPDAGCVRITHTYGRDRSGFTDNQAGSGPLGIVLGHKFIGHPAGTGSAAGKWAHHQTVGKLYGAKLHRLKQGRHSTSSNIVRSIRTADQRTSFRSFSSSSSTSKSLHLALCWLRCRASRACQSFITVALICLLLQHGNDFMLFAAMGIGPTQPSQDVLHLYFSKKGCCCGTFKP